MYKPKNFNSNIIKVRRTFKWKGFEFRICIIAEKYMNAEEPVETVEVLAKNGGKLPFFFSKRTSLKKIEEETIKGLERVYSIMGDNAINQLNETL